MSPSPHPRPLVPVGRTLRGAGLAGAVALAAPSAAHAAFWGSPAEVGGTANVQQLAVDTSPAGHTLLVAAAGGSQEPDDEEGPLARAVIGVAGPGALPTTAVPVGGEGADGCEVGASIRADGVGLAGWCEEAEDGSTAVAVSVVTPSGPGPALPVPVTAGADVVDVATVSSTDGLWVVVQKSVTGPTGDGSDDRTEIAAHRVDGTTVGPPVVLASATDASNLEAASTATGRALVTFVTATSPDEGENTTQVHAARSNQLGVLVDQVVQQETGTPDDDTGGAATGAIVTETALTPEAAPVLRTSTDRPGGTTQTARASVDGLLGAAQDLPAADLTVLAGGPGGNAAIQQAGPLLRRVPLGTGTPADVATLPDGLGVDPVAGTGRRVGGDSIVAAVSDAEGAVSVSGYTPEEGPAPIESGGTVSSLSVLDAGAGRVVAAYARDEGGSAVVLGGRLQPGVTPPPPVVTPRPTGGSGGIGTGTEGGGDDESQDDEETVAPDGPDTTRPTVSQVSLSSSVFRLSTSKSGFGAPRPVSSSRRASARSAAVRRLPRGTTLRFRLSERSRLQIDVYRLKLQPGPGKRRCGTPRRSRAGKARKVATWRGVRGTGAVRVTFGGRRGSRALSRGRYQMRIVARDEAGNRRIVRTKAFTLC